MRGLVRDSTGAVLDVVKQVHQLPGERGILFCAIPLEDLNGARKIDFLRGVRLWQGLRESPSV